MIGKEPIKTQRLVLEPLSPELAPQMLHPLSDMEIYRFMPGHPPDVIELQSRYSRQMRRWESFPEAWHNWGVYVDDCFAIGYIQATVNRESAQAEMAWVISSEYQGFGYAEEASLAIMESLRKQAGITVLTCHIDQRNSASIKLARKLGFTLSETLPTDSQKWVLLTDAS